MTRTTHPKQPAQPRRTTRISRWIIAACAAAILPASAQAGHQVNRDVLLPIVNKTHSNLATFEQLASQRWFPDHEFEYIRLMTNKACRLADAVKCNEHYGRIRVDYDVLRVFVRTVDQRLCRHRAAKFDHQLMQLWTSIKRDLDGAACLVRNECSARCGHLAPPVVAPPHVLHGASPWIPRGPGIPPTVSPLTRDFRTPSGRVLDVQTY